MSDDKKYELADSLTESMMGLLANAPAYKENGDFTEEAKEVYDEIVRNIEAVVDSKCIVINPEHITREDVDSVIYVYVKKMIGAQSAIDYDYSSINEELDWIEGSE